MSIVPVVAIWVVVAGVVAAGLAAGAGIEHGVGPMSIAMASSALAATTCIMCGCVAATTCEAKVAAGAVVIGGATVGGRTCCPPFVVAFLEIAWTGALSGGSCFCLARRTCGSRGSRGSRAASAPPVVCVRAEVAELLGPDTCPRQHFAWATAVRWEDAFPTKLLQWAYDQRQTFGPKLAQWRQAVVEDITGFVQELAEDQEAWLATSPQHVREVYKQGTPGYVFQLLAFSHLLKLLDFPEWDALVHDLFWGFPLLGHVPPGSGWLLRSDAKYSNPWTKEQFEAFNTEHVRQIVSKPGNDEHAETMLQEVLKEATKARFVGPYSLQWLQAQSERHNVYAARAFAIIQDDKIRRGATGFGRPTTVQCGTYPPIRGQPP